MGSEWTVCEMLPIMALRLLTLTIRQHLVFTDCHPAQIASFAN